MGKREKITKCVRAKFLKIFAALRRHYDYLLLTQSLLGGSKGRCTKAAAFIFYPPDWWD